ncbi:MAG: glycosyltransferase family 2 protein [Bacteroidetes bacterium]|nr:glycosyltransferase family 2 protein [Bacteroidota bacterium]
MDSVNKPFVSIIAPCYNEEAILELNINTIIKYMKEKDSKYIWEILIINDGSKDGTGPIADGLSAKNNQVRVIHHPTNLNLGNALQTGFKNSKGDIIVVMDIDLSYSEKYIELMTDKLLETNADIVIASPYMKGGKVTAVPFSRAIMSKFVNRFMSFAAQDKYYTFTGMVRAYRKSYIQTVNLKTKDYEVMPEIIYKSMILRAKIVEIPAHLDWTEQNKFAGKRTSSLRVLRSTFSGLMAGFIFRPYIFFMCIGAILLCLSLYQLVWLFFDTFAAYKTFLGQAGIEYPFSHSLSEQFKKNPQSFLVGGITLLAAIQFLSLGFVSLQSKRYFEELFHLGTSLKKEKLNQL